MLNVRPAITIGNFDGAHRAHAALIRAAVEAAEGGPVIVLAFEPHPATVLRPDAVPSRLSRFDQRSAWLTELGAAQVVQLVPTPQLLAMSPREFIADLAACFRPAAIVEGPDFRFGSNRAGSINTLREMEREFNYRTVVIESMEAALSDHQVVPVSSSMIRWLVAQGRMRDAQQLLGRPFELRGQVVPGEQRGRAIGVPTCNLEHGEQLLPADGVYAGLAALPDGRAFPAAISIGTKPTFGAHPRLCEAHLIGFNGPLDHYGWPLRLEFHRWLRDQLAYDSVAALVHQLKRDLEATMQPMSAAEPSGPPLKRPAMEVAEAP
jgi:riboflavin kinase/FMN adenylyltransferase